MARSGIRVEAPFLDGGVVASLAALTPEQRRYGRLHLLAHRRLFADLADIPRGNDGNAPDALDHVYWSGDRTIASQVWQLARSHPVSAARRLGTQGRGRIVARLPGHRLSGRLGDRIAAREEVFPAGLLARTSPVYRARLADYLEQGIPNLPPALSAPSVQTAVDQLRGSADLTFDPLVAARAATTGTWARLWSGG
jgi:asparagine synthase (glutamine-hydrolysing)